MGSVLRPIVRFWWIHCSGQIKFHTSGAARLQFHTSTAADHKLSKINDECRLTNVELRHSFYFIVKQAERHAAQAPALLERHPQFVPPKADQSSFVIP